MIADFASPPHPLRATLLILLIATILLVAANTKGKMKIRGVMAQKGDTLEYINKMLQGVFDILAKARSLMSFKWCAYGKSGS
jgi:hypothetical protein